MAAFPFRVTVAVAAAALCAAAGVIHITNNTPFLILSYNVQAPSLGAAHGTPGSRILIIISIDLAVAIDDITLAIAVAVVLVVPPIASRMSTPPCT